MKNILDICNERIDMLKGYLLESTTNPEQKDEMQIAFEQSLENWVELRKYALGKVADSKLKKLYEKTIVGMYFHNKRILHNEQAYFPEVYHDQLELIVKKCEYAMQEAKKSWGKYLK
jgi:hypothetical protein